MDYCNIRQMETCFKLKHIYKYTYKYVYSYVVLYINHLFILCVFFQMFLTLASSTHGRVHNNQTVTL